MELDYGLPIQFSIEGTMGVLIKISATLLIFHICLDLFTGPTKITWLLEYCAGSHSALELDSEVTHDIARLF